MLGYPFEFLENQTTRGSFLASIICDLAAFSGDARLYADVVNDIKASTIFPVYWQTADSKGLFQIDGDDVLTYPNVVYEDTITRFQDYRFADHIVNESRSFKLGQLAGPSAMMSIMLLLRDRYFPTMWRSLIDGRGRMNK